jgi:hypothetical protein
VSVTGSLEAYDDLKSILTWSDGVHKVQSPIALSTSP